MRPVCWRCWKLKQLDAGQLFADLRQRSARAAATHAAPRQQRKKNDQDQQHIHPHDILLHVQIRFSTPAAVLLLHPTLWSLYDPARRRGLRSDRRSPVRNSRSRSRSHASARQLRDANRGVSSSKTGSSAACLPGMGTSSGAGRNAGRLGNTGTGGAGGVIRRADDSPSSLR